MTCTSEFLNALYYNNNIVACPDFNPDGLTRCVHGVNYYRLARFAFTSLAAARLCTCVILYLFFVRQNALRRLSASRVL